ncbi:MipA/OmpV family protein [Rhodanobacter ginsengisoli]|uniref:MipA/OmpV family protein n=1 Tax=Rhodanobacter ginsengisoli TaxID=418646 RepID=A0ABW0QJ78_9GAMM
MIQARYLTLPHPRLLLMACLLWPITGMAGTGGSPILAIGAGMQRLPSWSGAGDQRSEPFPYVDIELPGHGSLSTLDGLQVDLIQGGVLHGGVYGNYQWGRQRDDLGTLAGKIAALPPRINLGGYLEWQLTRRLDLGGNLSHDINGAGAYLKLYAEWDLPSIRPLQHSLQLSWQAMNGAAMNRFFGISPAQAGALDVPAWQPGAGSQLAALEYDLFLPTGKHTGFALSLAYGRLLGAAGNSPLVKQFGSPSQWSESLAFIYHR